MHLNIVLPCLPYILLLNNSIPFYRPHPIATKIRYLKQKCFFFVYYRTQRADKQVAQPMSGWFIKAK